MGKFLANGIASSISIMKYDFFNPEAVIEEEEKENILKEMNRLFDISKYHIYNQGKFLNLDLDILFIEEHIHDLIKEMNPVFNCYEKFMGNFDKNNKLKMEDFTKEIFPIKIDLKETNQDYVINKKIQENVALGQNFNYILFDTRFKNIKIKICFLPLWVDCFKCKIENPERMLYLLNKFSRNYYKNELANYLLYFIKG